MKILFTVFVLLGVLLSPLFSQSIESKVDSINSIDHEELVSNLNASTKILESNLALAQSINYLNGIAKAYQLLGKVYYLNGKYDSSTKVYLLAIKVYEELGDYKSVANCYGEFGYQIKRRNLPKAEEMILKAINVAESNSIDSALTVLYDHYGVIKEMSTQLDSAEYFYSKALRLKKVQNDTIGIPYSLNHLASIAAIKGNYSLALKFLGESDFYRCKEKGEYGRTENLLNYADLYFTMKDYSKAKEKYLEGIASPGVQGQKYMLYYCYDKLSKVYEQMSDYKNAYLIQKKYSQVKDSVVNYETNKRVAELEIAFETSEKDKEIALSKIEINQKNSQLLVAVITIVALMIITLSIFNWQKTKREALRNELQLKEKIERAEYEKRLIDEKLRISKELHDNIGSQLTFLISSLDNITYLEKDTSKIEKLDGISSQGRAALNDLRNTIWAMKLEKTTFKELLVQVKKIKQNINVIPIEINSSINEDTKLPAEVILNIFRIIQEAVQNSVKYSSANKIVISFNFIEDELFLSIKDDGKGFDISKIVEGNGLSNMKHRAAILNAQLKISSNNNGTEVKVVIAI